MNNTYTSQPQFAPVIRPCHSASIFEFATVRCLSSQGDTVFSFSFSVFFCLFLSHLVDFVHIKKGKKSLYFVFCNIAKELSGVNLAGDIPDLTSATSKQPWQSKATKLITGCVFVFELKRVTHTFLQT